MHSARTAEGHPAIPPRLQGPSLCDPPAPPSACETPFIHDSEETSLKLASAPRSALMGAKRGVHDAAGAGFLALLLALLVGIQRAGHVFELNVNERGVASGSSGFDETVPLLCF